MLNRESGEIYTTTMVEHYRVYRHSGHWLSPGADEKLNDFYRPQTFLHAHSRDAAQQGFAKACKAAKACRSQGLDNRYPHRRKRWRTTVWKNTGIRLDAGVMTLALALGQEPIRVPMPRHLAEVGKSCFKEVRLVWDNAARHYFWHVTLEDGCGPGTPTGDRVAAIDLGEIHPAAVTDGEEIVVMTARELRSQNQYTNQRHAQLQQKLAKKTKGSLRYRRILARKNRFLAKQDRRKRDIEHKISRAVVDWAVERGVGTLAIGDVRDIADEVNKGTKSNQKISNWSHGKVRRFIEYKAEAKGITTELVDEAYSTQTCPNPECRHRKKLKGRVYTCPACGFRGHRDGVGAINLLSRKLYGDVGLMAYPQVTKYRRPFLRGRRSRLDTAYVARPNNREAAGL